VQYQRAPRPLSLPAALGALLQESLAPPVSALRTLLTGRASSAAGGRAANREAIARERKIVINTKEEGKGRGVFRPEKNKSCSRLRAKKRRGSSTFGWMTRLALPSVYV
jgi:hypothetical protein